MPKRRLKVSFIPTEVSGVNFYRLWQPAEALRRMGHEAAVLWYSSNMLVRDNWEIGLYDKEHQGRITHDINRACEWGDVVVWMGLHTQASWELWQLMRLRHPDKPFVMEMDDCVLSIPEYNGPAAEAYKPGSMLVNITIGQMKQSDALIVSTQDLAHMYRPFNKNSYVIRNVIDLSLWPCRTSPGGRRVNIGWVGGATHEADLTLIKNVVFEVAARRKDAKFTILHGCPQAFKHVKGCKYEDGQDPTYRSFYFGKTCPLCGGIPGIEWSADFASIKNYPRWVTSYKFDIGLAPLVKNPFNDGKSNLRWLEYSAQGIPTIASPLPSFTDSINHGETGFIAGSENEWIKCLECLLDSPGVRENVGRNARREVKDHWGPKNLGPQYRDALTEIIHAKLNPISPGLKNR